MYRNYPFMTLDSLSDEQQPPQPDMVQGMQSDETSGFGVFVDCTDTLMISTTIGSDKPMSKTDGPVCRELLDDIRRQTYLVEDQPGIMREVRDQLRELQAKLYHAIPKEKGIPLRNEGAKSKQSKCKVTNFHALPTRKRKLKFAGRVGEKKDKIKCATKIRLDEDATQCNLEEEIITSHYDDRFEAEESVSEDENASSGDITEICQDVRQGETKEMFTLKKAGALDIPLHLIYKPLRQYLNGNDLRSIGHGKSITGNVITVMQKMLQDQYPGVNGLQDPLNGVRLKFHVYKDTTFVQILHDGSYHWVAVST